MDRNTALLALTVLVAGCTEPSLTDSTEPAAMESPAASDVPSSDAVQDPGIDGTAPPAWEVGMWWTFRIGSTYAPAREITTIVVSADETSYAVGAASETSALETLWWHLPPIGVVARADLAWEAHDQPVSILRFPLADGAQWTGSMEGTDVDFTARRLPTGAFEVTGLYDGEWLAMRYTYDPAIGHFTNATLNYGSETRSWSTLELVASGRGWSQGAVLPMSDDAFMGGFGDPMDPRAMEQFEVPQDVTHVVVGCLAEGLVGDFRVEIVPSEGEAFSCGQAFASPGQGMQIVSAPGAPGTWRIAPTVAGPGSVFVEAANVWLLSCDPPADAGLLLKPHGSCHSA
jgi:hypothetical protein